MEDDVTPRRSRLTKFDGLIQHGSDGTSMPAGRVELLLVEGRLTIHGECDMATAGQIEDCLVGMGADRVDIDLSGVTFFDCCGLRVLLNALRRNQHVRVVNPSAAVRKVLEITGTGEYLVDGREMPV
jgi:anti-anti-sigma factor